MTSFSNNDFKKPFMHLFHSSIVSIQLSYTLSKKATTHQVTTMLATPKNVLFPGHNHLPTTGTDDLTLRLSLKRQPVVMTWK